MGKTVPKSKFTELKGLDRISQTVHDMNCLWREISKDDVGIDGEIEVLSPNPDGKGWQTTGGIIKVQAKSGASYIAWDSDGTFAVTVRKEDLEYWHGCTFPVLFVIYHPADDRLYCKEIKSYVRSTTDVFRPPYQVRFDKTQDAFEPAYRNTLYDHARVSPPRIEFSAHERLISNLLPVKKQPSVIRYAPTGFKSYTGLKTEAKEPLPPFCIVDGQLYTLANLNDPKCLLKPFCEGKAKELPSSQWANDPLRRGDYVFLLNQLLGKHLGRCGLRYNPEFRRNYFPRENDHDLEFKRDWTSVRTNKPAPARILAKHYTYGAFSFWRHLAAKLEFRQIGSRWFLQIIPMYFFTEDGTKPCTSELVGPYTTVLKSKEHNNQVLNHVLFWSHVLSLQKPSISLRLDGSKVMEIEKMPLCGIAAFAIPDDPAAYEEKLPSPQLALFDWNEDVDEFEEGCNEY